MNTINKALIAVLAIQGLLAVIMLGRVDSARLADAERLVPAFDANAIERIEIVRGTEASATSETEGTEGALVLAKENGSWVIRSHFDYPADVESVETLLGKVTNLSSRGPIAEGAARQQQLLVADDKYQRKVVLHSSAGTEPLVLYIGMGAGGRKSAVRVAGQEDIHGVTGFAPASAQYAVSAWMETKYFEIEANDIVAMTIENAAGAFAFERTESGSWKLTGGAGAALPGDSPVDSPDTADGKRELDQRVIDNAARAVSLLKINEPADPTIPRGSPLARVTLRLIPGAESGRSDASAAVEHVITVGPEWNGLYIINRDQAAPVLIHFNHLEPVVALSPNKLYRSVTAPAPPAGGAPAQPTHGQPGASPHGGQPMPAHGQHGASPHGAPPHGASPHGAPAHGQHGASPHGASPH